MNYFDIDYDDEAEEESVVTFNLLKKSLNIDNFPDKKMKNLKNEVL